MTLSFAEFLYDHGILSAKQAENYPRENKDSSTVLFHLADFFKSLTPSDCYDLALRLFLLYQHKASQQHQKEPIRPKESDSTIYLPTFEGSDDQEPTNTVNLKRTEYRIPQNHRSTAHTLDTGNARRNSPLQERPYSQNTVKKSTKLSNEEKRFSIEQKDFFLQPTISNYASTKTADHDSATKEKPDVFQRLQRDSCCESFGLSENKKAQLELQECAFQPNSKQLNNTMTAPNASFDPGKPSKIFDRLHSEHNFKKQQQLENEMIKQNAELSSCTFTPKINYRERSTEKGQRTARSSSRHRSEALYAEHAEKRRNIERMRLATEDKELKECTFKPTLVSKTPESVQSGRKGKPHERLLEWERERSTKLEEKQKEKALRESSGKKPQINTSVDLGRVSSEPAYERLYKESNNRKTKHEQLEKRVLEEIGVSFTPKTNVRRLSTQNSITKSREEKDNVRAGTREYIQDHREELKKLKERLKSKPITNTSFDSGFQNEKNESTMGVDKENIESSGGARRTSLTPSEHKKIFQQNLDQKLSQLKEKYSSQISTTK